MKKARQYRALRKQGFDIPFDPNDPKHPGAPVRTKRERAQPPLAPIQNVLQSPEPAEGLRRINRLLGNTKSPTRRAKLLGLVAELETKRGRFDDAIAAHRAARAAVAGHARAWLRPALGEVLCLLKAARVDEARDIAEGAWTQAAGLASSLEHEIAITASQFEKLGSATVRARPHRASVVGARLGALFRREGEIEIAASFFERSIASAPQGGTRARQGLAACCFALGRFADAERLALESIQFGKYRAKTLASWAILIRARAKRGIRGFEAAWMRGLRSLARDTVRARAILEIVRALRSCSDPAWQTIAEAWLAAEGSNFPTEATELLKLQIAEGGTQAARALQKMRERPELLSHSEWIAFARLEAKARLSSGGEPDLNGLLQRASDVSGPGTATAMLHACAVEAQAAGFSQLAVSLFERVRASAPTGCRPWIQSTWRLAREMARTGKRPAAADLFLELFRAPSLIERFRYRALMEGVLARIATPEHDPARDPETVNALKAALESINDFAVLLDIARDLLKPQGAVGAMKSRFFLKGETLARQAIQEMRHPAEAVRALHRLIVRQNDFGKYPETVALWEGLSPELRARLWMDRSEYWEAVAFVVRAYGWQKRVPDAERLAGEYLADPATPESAKTLIGSCLGIVLVWNGLMARAMEVFDATVQHAPNSVDASWAYYWQGLRAVKRMDFTAAAEAGKRIARVVPENPRLLWQRRMVEAAAIFRDPRKARAAASNPSALPEHLAKNIAKLP